MSHRVQNDQAHSTGTPRPHQGFLPREQSDEKKIKTPANATVAMRTPTHTFKKTRAFKQRRVQSLRLSDRPSAMSRPHPRPFSAHIP